jgi:hypothetical protein
MYPGEAKARNIKIYIQKNDDDSDDEKWIKHCRHSFEIRTILFKIFM